MDIIIQSLGFSASSQLESFIREKLQKVNTIGHDIIRADVTLTKGPEKGGEDNQHTCDIRLEMAGNDPFAKRHAASFEEAITSTIDALLEILRRNKEKDIDRQRGVLG